MYVCVCPCDGAHKSEDACMATLNQAMSDVDFLLVY